MLLKLGNLGSLGHLASWPTLHQRRIRSAGGEIGEEPGAGTLKMDQAWRITGDPSESWTISLNATLPGIQA